MKPTDFISTLQRRTGVTAIGPSALRQQGAAVLTAAQDYVGLMDLTGASAFDQDEFKAWLGDHTEALLDALPIRNRPWGTARKAINLFLRDVLYNQYLNDHFGFAKLEPWLEIPLDHAVATGLIDADKNGRLHRWPGLKHLKPEVSRIYQEFASEKAKEKGVERVHLDIYLWLENR